MADNITLENSKNKKIKKRDLFVILLCLSGIAVSLYMFQDDLFRTLRSSAEPAGFVVTRSNSVQRRLEGRNVWDRLHEESQVYYGDLIHIARLSSATLNINNSNVILGEYTVIRIRKDISFPLIDIIDMRSGDIGIESSKDGGGTLLLVGGRVVEAAAGTVFNVSYGEDGFLLDVSEGAARVIQDDQIMDAPAGTIVVQDAAGNIIREPMTSVIYPRPNERYIRTTRQPQEINFSWRRINLQDDDLLRLDISADRNFDSVVYTAGNLDSNAMAAVDSGLWHWRIVHDNAVLSTGFITVADITETILILPSDGHTFSFAERQEVQFRWSENTEITNYMLQVSGAPDFYSIELSVQAQGTFFLTTGLGSGSWFWRVTPVLPNNSAAGVAAAVRSSQTSSFIIESNVTETEPLADISPYDAELESLIAFLSRTPVELPPAVPPPAPTPVSTPAASRSTPASVAASAPVSTQTAAAPAQTSAATAPQTPSLFAPPGNRLPASGYRITAETLRQQRYINFSWAAVQGANAYILTIYRDTSSGRRQVFQTEPLNRLSYTFDDLRQLVSNGAFYWQVEAVYTSNGRIERRGRQGENAFALDVRRPERVQTSDSGVLYGN